MGKVTVGLENRWFLSVLASVDGGVTYDELNEARLVDAPMLLRLENLVARWLEVPGFYAHPTFIGSDPVSGIAPLAQAGVWSMTPSMVEGHAPPATFDAPQPVYAWAELRSLSLFGVFTGNLAASPGASAGGTTTLGGGATDTTVTSLPVGGGGAGTTLSGGGGGNPATGGTPGKLPVGVLDPAGTTALAAGGSDVWVDFAYSGQELGTQLMPFNTVTEGIEAVMSGGSVWIRPGVTNETLSMVAKPVALQIWDTPARQPGDSVEIGDEFACGPDADSFLYPDFGSTVGLTAAGSAALSGTVYDLIPLGDSDAGAVWTKEKKAVVRGFDVTFQVRLLAFPDPTDGFAFVVQNDSAMPTLQNGGNMGYSAIGNCLAVEFDGIRNPETNDPSSSFDHVAVMRSAAGNNAKHDAAHELAVAAILELDGRTVTVRVVYDASVRTLSVFEGGSLKIALPNFDIENFVTLDDGRAWLGVMATSGPNVLTGPTQLQNWSGDIPSGCGETSDWLQPFLWDATFSYRGDEFDHEILDPSVRIGDMVQESKIVIGDGVGGLTSDEIEELQMAPFPTTWIVESNIKHGRLGSWRNDIDAHAFAPSAFPTIAAWFVSNDVGSITMKQEMTHVPSGRVYMKHKITFKIVAIRANDPCGYNAAAVGHVVVDKSGAHNPNIWPGLPSIPCKP